MRMRLLRSGLTLGLLAIALTSSARAGLSIVSVVGGSPTGQNYANFDDLKLGTSGGLTAVVGPSSDTLTVSFTGSGEAVKGSVSGRYAAPYLSANNALNFGNVPATGQDTSVYLSSGIGSVILGFSGPQQYLGLLWGSVDNYNSLEFFNGNTSVGKLTGHDVTTAANGDRGENGTFYVNINSTLAFNRVVASSTDYAFEFDNVAFALRPVPEPATFTMSAIGLGLLGLGALRRRKRRNPAVARD